MAANLTLKWGNVKGWDGFDEGTSARAALDKWLDSGPGISAMARTNEEERELICGIIDAVDGEIWNDWDGVMMSKDDAKKYVMEYGTKE